jgi:ABC-type transporter Mla subunit MlaD
VVVEIQPGAGQAFTPGQPVALQAREVPSFASILEKVSDGVDEVRAFAQAERPVVEESLGNLRDGLGNFRDGAGRLNELLDPETGGLPRTLADARDLLGSLKDTVAENRESLGQTVADAKELTGKLRSDYEALQPRLQSAATSLDEVGKSLSDFFAQHGDELGRTAASLSTASRRIETLLQVNGTRIDAIFEDLRHTAATVRTTVDDLERNPWKLVARPLKKDDYTQNLYDTARSLVMSTRELVRVAEELDRLKAEYPSAEQERLEKALQAVRQELDRSAELQEQLWRALKAGPK